MPRQAEPPERPRRSAPGVGRVRQVASRDDPPARLLDAKRDATARFLRPSGRRPIEAAYAVSVRPEWNVVGVGIGPKISAGQPTGAGAIRFYVERKVAARAIPEELRLPEMIDGIVTDVIEAGRFRVRPATTPVEATPIQRQRRRPAQPGCSVGFRFLGGRADLLMAGTFGALVEAGGAWCILSNNHVLANENDLPIGSLIYQPGPLDGGDSADKIAELTRFVPIERDGPNAVDCAIAAVLDQETVRPAFLPRVGRLAGPEPTEATINLRVHKVGRTTGYTTGTVFDDNADVKVAYEMGAVIFEDQVVIRSDDRGPFSEPGDSGSVIVDRDTRLPTALLFAGSSRFTIANRLAVVLDQLDARVIASISLFLVGRSARSNSNDIRRGSQAAQAASVAPTPADRRRVRDRPPQRAADRIPGRGLRRRAARRRHRPRDRSAIHAGCLCGNGVIPRAIVLPQPQARPQARGHGPTRYRRGPRPSTGGPPPTASASERSATPLSGSSMARRCSGPMMMLSLRGGISLGVLGAADARLEARFDNLVVSHAS